MRKAPKEMLEEELLKLADQIEGRAEATEQGQSYVITDSSCIDYGH